MTRVGSSGARYWKSPGCCLAYGETFGTLNVVALALFGRRYSSGSRAVASCRAAPVVERELGFPHLSQPDLL
jgi:hypothetical protein